MSMRRPRSPAKSPRNVELAKIHIAAQQLGLRTAADDSAYRDMLWSIGRVRSAKDLDAGGRAAVLRHLVGCGWKDTTPPAPGRYQKGTPAAFIRWLWTALARAGAVQDGSDRALRRYIAQHAGIARGTPEVAAQHLDRSEANQVIEQLKRWLARVHKEAKAQ